MMCSVWLKLFSPAWPLTVPFFLNLILYYSALCGTRLATFLDTDIKFWVFYKIFFPELFISVQKDGSFNIKCMNSMWKFYMAKLKSHLIDWLCKYWARRVCIAEFKMLKKKAKDNHFSKYVNNNCECLNLFLFFTLPHGDTSTEQIFLEISNINKWFWEHVFFPNLLTFFMCFIIQITMLTAIHTWLMC